MSKPTIFFSHAGGDRKFLTKLKQLLEDKTSGTVDIFLSSDGQSIPFGHNWVHKIEKALNKADLMFVFLSPKSLRSQWVFFEAGYIYSKDIEVIPVGILGIDLSEIDPPLELLQGFNLQSSDQLQNFLSIINDKFNFSHDETCTDEEYQCLVEAGSGKIRDDFKNLISLIDLVQFELFKDIKSNSEGKIDINPNFRSDLISYLGDNNISFTSPRSTKRGDEMLLHGIKISPASKDSGSYLIQIDPFLLGRNLPLIKEILHIAYENYEGRYFLKVFFQDFVELVTIDYKISSRLYDTHADMVDSGLYKFRNIKFKIDEESKTLGKYGIDKEQMKKPAVRIIYEIDNLSDIPFYQLINFLIESGIISKT